MALNKIIGRDRELQLLKEGIESDRAELITVYGRRRIGKTFLVKEFFDNKFDFYATGIYKGSQKDELLAFSDMLVSKGAIAANSIKSWMDAFRALRDYLDTLGKKKLILFLDELPWFDIPPGRFIKAFEWFWNSWASTKTNLKLIVCGSATSWMTDKFISNKGGLYNRTTIRIHLSPFNLNETDKLLKSKNIVWTEETVLNAYMILGGVPYYLDMLHRNLSLDANIDRLFFADNAPLKYEYDFLFQSLFRNSEYYNKIVNAISEKNHGITRKEILDRAKLADNGTLTTALQNLIRCDFIRKYDAFGKKGKDSLYQLTDLSVLFHKCFVEHYNGKDERYWENTIDSARRRAWSGIAFEQVCLVHLPQIKQALGISGVKTDVCSWTFQGNEEYRGCQIDLLIERNDKVINLCEMKYSSGEYAISKDYAGELQERKEIFREVTKTRYSLHQTLVTTYGLKKNPYSAAVNQCITLRHLFAENWNATLI